MEFGVTKNKYRVFGNSQEASKIALPRQKIKLNKMFKQAIIYLVDVNSSSPRWYLFWRCKGSWSYANG